MKVIVNDNEVEIREDNTVVLNGRVYKPVDDEPKPWPQKGDQVYILPADGSVCGFLYNTLDEAYLDWLAQGNLFPTRSEAEAERDRRAAEHKVLTRLRELSGDWVADWSDDRQCKAFPVIWRKANYLVPETTFTKQVSCGRMCAPLSAWQQVIEEMPDDVRRMMG